MTPARNPDELSALAHRHLWMHFSRLGGYGPDSPVHVIARGKGCELWDATGHRLLDGLSGLFTVQVGHGRSDLGAADHHPNFDKRSFRRFENRRYHFVFGHGP